MARASDFVYIRFKAPIAHATWDEEIIGKAIFNIRGDKDGAGEDDFWDAVDDLKSMIDKRLRSWDENKKEWTILMTCSVKETLCKLFRNAEGLIEETESQLSFPW